MAGGRGGGGGGGGGAHRSKGTKLLKGVFSAFNILDVTLASPSSLRDERLLGNAMHAAVIWK